MNLTITPVNFRTNYQNNNCRRNNQQQSFEAMPIKVKAPRERVRNTNITSIARRRDTVIDRFMGKFEDLVAGKIDTDALGTKGYSVVFTPRFENSSKMRAVLQHNNKAVHHNKKPVEFFVSNGTEFEQAQNFATTLGQMKL